MPFPADDGGEYLACSVGRIKEMDETGIELQVLSFTSPGPQLSDKAAEGEALAREANE